MTKPDHADRILVAADHQLVSKTYYIELWKRAREVHKDLRGREAWLDFLTITYESADRLYFPDGRRYYPPDIDEVFTDPQNRWMSRFLKADASGEAPAHFCRNFERLRLIDLACRLWHLIRSPGGPS